MIDVIETALPLRYFPGCPNRACIVPIPSVVHTLARGSLVLDFYVLALMSANGQPRYKSFKAFFTFTTTSVGTHCVHTAS